MGNGSTGSMQVPARSDKSACNRASLYYHRYRTDQVRLMLRLTKKADYSLIALKHLASRHGDPANAAVSAKEVADQYGIPLPLLSKILQKLTRTGLLVSEHG